MKLGKLLGMAVLSLGLVSAVALAGDKNSAGYVDIQEIKVWGQAFDVYLTADRNPDCEGRNDTYFRVNTTNANRANHTAVLMASFMAGKKVSVSYTCDSAGFAYIDGVRVKH